MNNVQQVPEYYPTNWTLHGFCPTCKTKSVGGCRCMLSDQSCANGHSWYVCPIHGKTIVGQSDHSGDTFRCRCDDTAHDRNEL